jgi:lysozyme
MTTITLSESLPAGTYTLAPIASPVAGPNGDVGVDLSTFNDVKDFLAIKNAGKKVLIHRCTLGSTGLDKQYRNRWPEIVQTKFDFYGIYHLFIPGVSGKAQYDNLMAVTQGDLGNYPLTVDVEPIPDGQTYPNPMTDVIAPLRDMLSLIKATYKPIIYTRASAATIMGFDKETWLLDYPLHTANYTLTGTALVSDPWHSAAKMQFAWQHWNKGVVPGVLGNVDLDSYTGLPFTA